MDFFSEKGVPGKIVDRPFDNFEATRNYALSMCIGMSDFVLLLDADMILTQFPEQASAPSNLTGQTREQLQPFLAEHDQLSIFQGDAIYYYKNTRIVRNNNSYTYTGVTHEYIHAKSGYTVRECHVPRHLLFIHDICDGGCKTDKFERDARLLYAGIEADPTNVRYHFYLANTLHDIGQNDGAIEYYQKRIDLGGWCQEIWYSYYRMGVCWMNKGVPEKAITCFLNAYAVIPERVENLYQLFVYYKNTKQYPLAQVFYNLAYPSLLCSQSAPGFVRDHQLFLEAYIYDHQMAYDFTTMASYLGVKHVNNEIVNILNSRLSPNQKTNTLYNMQFYKFVLKQSGRQEFDDQFVDEKTGHLFRSSSSSLLAIESGRYLMNVRYVSYNIEPDGSYSGKIHTRNKQVQVSYDSANKRFTVEGISKYMDEPFTDSKRVMCVEDIRIFQLQNQIGYIGTGLFPTSNHYRIGIVFGKYNKDNYQLETCDEIVPLFTNSSCEKNWVFTGLPLPLPLPLPLQQPQQPQPGVDVQDELVVPVIYKWYPLQLCHIRGSHLHLSREINMPPIFSRVRGSSTGFFDAAKNEVWFVVHLVSYEKLRHYYHMIVVFTPEMNLKRYSAPFKFEGIRIEFCLSIVVCGNQTLMNYSTMDRTTRIGIYDTDYLNSEILIYRP
jgi:tetratricopeptide (TPR) repeat protein